MAMGVPHLPLSWLAEAGPAFIGGSHGARVPELCAALDAFGLPESIQHDDLHDNNVFLRDGRLALHDWGDATVAHPLFSYMKAFEVARRDGTDPAPLLEALLEPWTAHLPKLRLEAACELALPLSRISYALQLQRHVDRMPPADRPPYEEHRDEHLTLARAGIDDLV
jgi:Ser/Thr protein kinase RdoA (MazF antagonist)